MNTYDINQREIVISLLSGDGDTVRNFWGQKETLFGSSLQHTEKSWGTRIQELYDEIREISWQGLVPGVPLSAES